MCAVIENVVFVMKAVLIERAPASPAALLSEIVLLVDSAIRLLPARAILYPSSDSASSIVSRDSALKHRELAAR